MNNLANQMFNGAVDQQGNNQNMAFNGQYGVNAPQNNGTQAVFTQEQLNSIISGRVNPLTQKINELTAQLNQAQATSNGYLNELTGLKQRNFVSNLGIPNQMLDFVVFESNKLAVNGKSFEDAVKEYTESNKQLFGVAQMGVQGGLQQTPAVAQPTQVSASPAQGTQTNQQTEPSMQTAYQPTVSPTIQASSPTNQNGVVPAQGSQVQATNGVVQAPQAQQGGVVQNQVGSTGFSALAPAQTNSIDSSVTEFLKKKGLSK